MASNSWVQSLLPCLRPRPASNKSSTPFPKKEVPLSEGRPSLGRKDSAMSDLPKDYEDGLEPVVFTKSRPRTMLVPELPCPTPTMQHFSSPRTPVIPRTTVSRSKSDGLVHWKLGSKTPKSKRERSQTLQISGPTNVRKGAMDDPKLAFPLTYPSPSRTRPERMNVDRRDPSLEQERPRTAPTTSATHQPARKNSFPLRSDSMLNRGHTWRLAPLPPMPALQLEGQGRDRSGSSSSPIRRKPVPLRIRGYSNPSSPRTGRLGSDGRMMSIGRAIEMPGSLPPTTKKSPVELAAALPAAVEMGMRTPLMELDSATREAADHTSIASLPVTPTSPIYANRLSEGARDLLNFFPTTPKLGRANSIKTTPRPSSTPPLSPRLVEYAESRYATMVGRSTTVTVKQVQIGTPNKTSPHNIVLPSDYKQSPSLPSAQHAQVYAGKALPPTPQSAVFARDRFISIAAGLEITDLTGLVGLGITTGQQTKRSSGGESIQVFLAQGRHEPTTA